MKILHKEIVFGDERGEITDILEKEFEPSQIKRRRGAFGEELDYVETADVIRRLNAAFDGVWSFEIVD